MRPGLLGARRDSARFGLDPARRTLFAVGGSLGAKGLNDAVLAGLGCAAGLDPTLVRRVQVIHSTGPGDADRVAAAYAQLGLRAFVRPFVAEMGEALATADLVVCRGGASTLAEVAATARPAVVVPYPHHADRQQWKNAEPLVRAGLATVVEERSLDPAAFRREVLDRLAAPTPPAGRGGGAPASLVRDGAAAAADDLVRWMGEAGARSPGRTSARGRVPAATASSPAGSAWS